MVMPHKADPPSSQMFVKSLKSATFSLLVSPQLFFFRGICRVANLFISKVCSDLEES